MGHIVRACEYQQRQNNVPDMAQLTLLDIMELIYEEWTLNNLALLDTINSNDPEGHLLRNITVDIPASTGNSKSPLS